LQFAFLNCSKGTVHGIKCNVNPLPHGVLATFCLTAEGLIGPLTEDDIS
jgi:hypothetical protein